MDASSLGLNEIVVSASRKKEKITDAPSVVSVVNQQTIRRRVGVLDFNRLASLAKELMLRTMVYKVPRLMQEVLMVLIVHDLDNLQMVYI